MPHYVTKNDDQFYIFSTAVMGAITPHMTAHKMFAHLQTNDYTSWLDPRPWDEQNPEPVPEDPVRAAWQTIRLDEQRRYTYWNDKYGFWYVTEEDGYFV